MNNKIVVIGSTNTDMVIKTPHFPVPGETVLGDHFFMNPGGKGANQAVAAVRLGGGVAFIAKVGNDIFGEQSLQQFREEGLTTIHIFKDLENPSGIALITVDYKGENSIVVAPGSNGTLSFDDVQKAEQEIQNCRIVLMQLEIPLSTVVNAARLAAHYGKRVILNPAPAVSIPDELLNGLFMITPNRTEAEVLTGVKITDVRTAEAAAAVLLGKGVKNIVITLGTEGAYYYNRTSSRLVPTVKVDPVDTTAAGDVFNGALAVALSEDCSIEEAIRFANKAAAISVTKMGAQASAPYRNEVYDWEGNF